MLTYAVLAIGLSNSAVDSPSESRDTVRVTSESVELADTLMGSWKTADPSMKKTNGSPTQGIGIESLARLGIKSMDEALKTVTGMTVQDYGGIGGMKTVSVRGMGAQHTSVFYDGISMADLQSGMADIGLNNFVNKKYFFVTYIGKEDISTSAKQILSSSTVEMLTEVPRFEKFDRNGKIQPFNLAFQASYRSFQTVSPELLWEQKIGEKVILSADFSYLCSKGNYPFEVANGSATERLRREGSEVSKGRGEINLWADLDEDGYFEMKLLGDLSRRNLPGPAILYTQNPTESTSDRKILASLAYHKSLNEDLKLRTSASWNYCWTNYTDSSKLYRIPLNDYYKQNMASISATVSYTPVYSLELALAQDLDAGHLRTTLEDCPFPVRLQSTTALSAKYWNGEMCLIGSLAGLWQKDFVQSGAERKPLWRLSPALSMSWELPRGFALRAAVRDGFRAPTFNDLYWARIGNRNLRPEKAFQSNIGLSWGQFRSTRTLSITADVFCNLVKDKIVATPTLFVWSMQNIGKALMAGCDVNANADWKLTPDLRLVAHAGYSYMYAVDITDPEAANYLDQIRYTPRHSCNAQFSLDSRWITFSTLVNAVGRRWYGNQNIQSLMLKPYCDLGVSLSHEFQLRQTRLMLGAEGLNLIGTNYEIIRSYPMPGRQFRITMRISY